MVLDTQRWYDVNPTLSMAVSLLLNTAPRYQDLVTDFLYEEIANINPMALHQVIDDNGFLWFNRRTTLSRRAWMVIESLKFLPNDDQERLAKVILDHVYHLENNLDDAVESEPSPRYRRMGELKKI